MTTEKAESTADDCSPEVQSKTVPPVISETERKARRLRFDELNKDFEAERKARGLRFDELNKGCPPMPPLPPRKQAANPASNQTEIGDVTGVKNLQDRALDQKAVRDFLGSK